MARNSRLQAHLQAFMAASRGVRAGKAPSTVATQLQQYVETSQGLPSAGKMPDNIAPLTQPFGQEVEIQKRYGWLPSAGKLRDSLPEVTEGFLRASQNLPSAGRQEIQQPNLEGYLKASRDLPTPARRDERVGPSQDGSLNDPVLQEHAKALAQTGQTRGTQMYLAQNSFNGGELSPEMLARFDQTRYQTGCEELFNMIPLPQGGITKRPGMEYCQSSEKHSVLIPFVFSDNQSRVLEIRASWGGGTLVVWNHDGSYYATGLDLPYNIDDLNNGLSYAQSADVVYIATEGKPPAKIMRYGNTDWRYAVINWKPSIAKPTNITLSAGGEMAEGWEQQGKVYYEYVVTAVDENGEEGEQCEWTVNNQIKTYKQSASWNVTVRWDPVPGAVEYRVYKKDSGVWGYIGTVKWTGSAESIAEAQQTAADARARRDAAYNDWQALKTQYDGQCVITAIDPDTGESSSIENASPFCTQLREDMVAKENEYKRLVESARDAEAAAETSGPNFIDTNIGADTEDTPPFYDLPFEGSGNYPRCVFLHQQRLGWASTQSKPLTVWMSNTSMYERMAYSVPPKDDDRIEATLAAPAVNRILWCESDRDGLLVGTEGSEWIFKATEGAAITPNDLSFQPQTNYGSEKIMRPMLRVGNNVVFLQRGGRVVRAFGYNFTSDKYDAQDCTLMSRHMFKDYAIVDWAFQQEPYNIVWCVREDGFLVGFTFMEDQKVFAWHRHETNGAVKHVCCIPGPDGNDELWLHVMREDAPNQPKYYIEKLRSFSVDASADNTAYLDGIHNATYAARCVPCLPEGNIQNGPSFLHVRKINAVKARVIRSCPFTARVGDVQPLPVPIRSLQYTADKWAEYAAQYVSGHRDWALPLGSGWRENDRLTLVFEAPAPVTVLGITTTVEVADMAGGQQ